MSPAVLRRYRAERLLRQEFEGLRGRVLGSVRGRLAGCGASLDPVDLEACYSQAWQGLYMAMLEGQEIANPTGWLVLVTFRRAIEERRARERNGTEGRPTASAQALALAEDVGEGAAAPERDLAADLDDRTRLRHLLEGLRTRLDAREREAATLCYLQGFSRAEAAARMGVSEARMRKLMEGSGGARPGVAGKVGVLVKAIQEGSWCEEQGSLMRALAFGVLDPDGERYGLAMMHSDQCPSCRAYVASLRGLAAVLPPVLLPGALGASVAVGAAEAGHAGAAGTSSAAGSGAAAPGTSGVGGAVSASGAGVAGVGGAAGGGWLMGAGPLGAKLAVGCALALSVGVGCVALGGRGADTPHRGGLLVRSRGHSATRAPIFASPGAANAVSAPVAQTTSETTSEPPSRAARASREFGPEQELGTGRRAVGSAPQSTAHTASVDSGGATSARPSGSSEGEQHASPTREAASAAREFAPG